MNLCTASGAREASAYNFAYLDEQTKRMIRRGLLKAVAIPGYQVPFGGREMPAADGWGTGGMQLTAAILVRTMCSRSSIRAPRHHQRGVDSPLLRPHRWRRHHRTHRRRPA